MTTFWECTLVIPWSFCPQERAEPRTCCRRSARPALTSARLLLTVAFLDRVSRVVQSLVQYAPGGSCD
jgi:hypothetical protein